VSALADELLNAAKSNREGLVKLIRGEVSDLIDSSSSLAKAADVEAVRSMLSQLGTDLDGLRQQAVACSSGVLGRRRRRERRLKCPAGWFALGEQASCRSSQGQAGAVPATGDCGRGRGG